jgi:hypothetical protein
MSRHTLDVGLATSRAVGLSASSVESLGEGGSEARSTI